MKNITKECISAKEFSIEIQRLVKEVMSSDFTGLLGEDITLDVFVEDFDNIVGARAVFFILFNNQGEILSKNIQVYTDNPVNVSGGAPLIYNKDILFQDAYFRIYQIIKFLVEHRGGDSELEDNFLSIAKEKLEINLKRGKMKYYETDSIITRDKLKNNPDVLYLFGDNIERKGYGGQAKEMRGEPNAIGIVTKRYPSNKNSSFFTDAFDYDSFRERINSDYLDVISYILRNKPKAVVVPPMGVGLADLPNRAPKCYAYLQDMLENLRFFIEHSSLIRW